MRLLTFLTVMSLLATAPHQLAAQDAASLRTAIEEHYAAIHSGDMEATVDHHLPEFTWFSSDGRPLMETGAQDAAARMGAVLDFGTANVYMNHFSAQIYDNVGVATFYLVGTHEWGGEVKNGTWRVSAVWVHDGNQWREAHHHESPLEGEIRP